MSDELMQMASEKGFSVIRNIHLILIILTMVFLTGASWAYSQAQINANTAELAKREGRILALEQAERDRDLYQTIMMINTKNICKKLGIEYNDGR